MSRAHRAKVLITLERAVGALDGVSPVAPLKGALLELTCDPGRAARVADVDLLVPEGHFDAAERALVGRGFTRVARDRDDRARTFGGHLVAVDLHRRLFKWGLFRMSTAEVFARSRVDRELLGVPVHLLDPYDVATHAIGHAAGGPLDARRRERLRSDLAALGSTGTLDPGHLAGLLQARGMGRAARYALDASREFDARVLAALGRDRVGRWLAAAAPVGMRAGRLGPVVAQHALNASLARGVLSLGSHLIHGARQRAGELR